MPLLYDYLHSPAWWLAAVVVAVLLNIVGAFAVRGIDRWGGQISSRWSTRTATKTRRSAQLIAAVRGDVGRLIWVGFQAQSQKTSGLLLYGWAMFLFLLVLLPGLDEVTGVFLLLMGLLAVMLGTFFVSRAADLEAVLHAVEPEWPVPPGASS
jgi:hypothetical protein